MKHAPSARSSVQVALAMLLFVVTMGVAAPASAQMSCPRNPQELQAAGSLQSRVLTNCNFSGWDLRGADFAGATLINAVFIKAKLVGAKFDGATIQSGVGDLALHTNFSFANLTQASFIAAKFRGPAPNVKGMTYFSHADITCADFSRTDISTNAVFGPLPLTIRAGQDCDPKTANDPNPKFQMTTMNCEFLADWNAFDLTGATVSACQDQFKGHDFSGAMLAGVVFDGMDLTGSKWQGAALTVAGPTTSGVPIAASFQAAILDSATGFVGANLTGVVFRRASAKKLDFSGATLNGAVFDNANLQGVKMVGADLGPCPTSKSNCTAATLVGAYLKNADLTGSKLESTDFTNASMHSSVPVGTGTCDVTKGTCASARNATLTNTVFTSAYLAGADFSGVVGRGAKFDGAVLTGANFANTSFSIEPNAVASTFANTLLQGTGFNNATLGKVSMSGAFVDFASGGNNLSLLLNEKHTDFPGWTTPKQKVCTRVTYGDTSQLPTSVQAVVCPDGVTHGAPDCATTGTKPCGCGAMTASANSFWNNNADIAQNDPQGSYGLDPTYGSKAAPICKRDLAW
jgi:uncharacterized protein YjbI with pentapeptide repeats